MSDAQLLALVFGLALNFVGLVVGIVGLAFRLGREIAGMRAEVGERLATVEAHIQNLREGGGRNGKLRSQAG